MTLKSIQITDFRCIASAEMAFGDGPTLISGDNGAGKTSLLEAIFFTGRGRSFRSARPAELIREGQNEFILSALAGAVRLGISHKSSETTIRVGGKNGTGADLAHELPIQAIDPAVHELVTGSPGVRRSYIDWGVFHVEHRFLDAWRRYRRALKQRNALLRQSRAAREIAVWNEELVVSGTDVDIFRRAYLEAVEPTLQSALGELLDFDVAFEYVPGWSANLDLAAAIERSAERDRVMQSTQVGPHRADLRIQVSAVQAKKRVSRGQQKLLGAGLLIAQLRHFAAHLGKNAVLLVDDPLAELDSARVKRLIAAVEATPAQLVVTAIHPDVLPLSRVSARFHVEHGEVANLL